MTSTYFGYGNKMIADTTDELKGGISEEAAVVPGNISGEEFKKGTGDESKEEAGEAPSSGTGEEIKEGITEDAPEAVSGNESGEEVSKGTDGDKSEEETGVVPIESSSEIINRNSDEAKETQENSNTVVKEYTVKLEGDNLEQSKSISIPDLLDVINVSTNTGDVDYTVDEERISLNLSNGTNTKEVQTGGSYTPSDSTTITDSRTTNPGESSSSLPSSISYSNGGYSGILQKDGSAYVSSGSYTPSDSKFVTEQASRNYNSGGYSGTLSSYLYSGSYTPGETRFVSGQPSSYYNSGGYTGYLETYVYSGSYTPSSTTTISNYVGKTQSGYCDTRMGSNWWNCSSKPSNPSSVYYSANGYSGTLYYSDYQYYQGSEYDSGNGHRRFDYSRNWYYSGTVTKPSSDTRIFKYQGTVSKPAIDTRVYRYEGTVYKPSSDTRIWKQEYSGVVNKPAVDTRTYKTQYTYEVTIQYRGLPSSLGLAVTNVTDLGATLKWSNVDAFRYELYRDGNLVYQGKNLVNIEGALMSDTTYNYMLKAIFENGKEVEETIQVSTSPGSLSILSVPAHVTLPDTILNGEVQKIQGDLSRKIVIKDTRKVRDGWTLKVKGSAFASVDGEREFPSNSVDLRTGDIVQTRGQMKNLPHVSTLSKIIDDSNGAVIASADSSSTGYGVYEIDFPSNAIKITLDPKFAYINKNKSPLNYSTEFTWFIEEGN
jgi:hypothetical protein